MPQHVILNQRPTSQTSQQMLFAGQQVVLPRALRGHISRGHTPSLIKSIECLAGPWRS